MKQPTQERNLEITFAEGLNFNKVYLQIMKSLYDTVICKIDINHFT